MELRARIRPLSRRAAFLAALVALVASAVAGAVAPSAHAAKKKKAPVIKKVSPLDIAVGETLTIRGRHFIKGRKKNTVVFKRAGGGRAVFAKGSLSTSKMLRVKVPESLTKQFRVKGGYPVPTRFRLRVLAKKFGKRFTSLKRSPVVSGPRPQASPADDSGDCDLDGTKNGVDTDDDNDLLGDPSEKAIGTDPCKLDTDGDGVEDGYEYQSAVDLNDDEYQVPNKIVAYPRKMPYPNPGFAGDEDLDFDGDSLPLSVEYQLWKYTYEVGHTASRTLSPLSYSDGMQHSLFAIDPARNNRRVPGQPFATYPAAQQFVDWANASGYLSVDLRTTNSFSGAVGSPNGSYDIRNIDLRDGVESGEFALTDLDNNGRVSDLERDEDIDGLSNYDELRGRMQPGYWTSCYAMEAAAPIGYEGTSLVDADTDGDGVRDGADDQDHDDVPNIMELSRNEASNGLNDTDGSGKACTPDPDILKQDLDADGKPDPLIFNHPGSYGRVNPFNPCLPFDDSRTCSHFHVFGSAFAPFDGSPDWLALQ